MLVKQELIGKIKDYFDLNIYETKVWLALLARGVASAGQVASDSRVPRSRTYDVLESLEKKGFAIVKLGKPVKYIGVKPPLIIEKLKNNVAKSAEEKMVSLTNIRDTEEFSKLEELYKQGINPIKREEFSLALKGKTNISSYLREVLLNAQKEVIICTSAEDVSSKIRLFKQMLDDIKQSKAKTKVALFGDERLIKKLSDSLQVRIKKIDVDAKFFIVDRKEMLFYVSKDSNEKSKEDTAIWINSEFFSLAFASLFDKAFEK
ncbi:TrmB family transcriptional regulator [Candidatus Pacearchaeota archaeon]|nr:TrmB family transcriptional regulator [Candidatus Pacearchaeota archaeon]